MSVDIHCEIDGKWYQDIDVKFPGNEWMEKKSKDILEYKGTNRIEFFLL